MYDLASVMNADLYNKRYKSINYLHWQIIGVNVLHYVPSDLNWQGIDVFYFYE